MTRTAELDDLREAVNAAVDFANEWDQPYRAAIFQAALRTLHPAREDYGGGNSTESASRGMMETAGYAPLRHLADKLDVDLDSLQRLVHFGEDGAIDLLFRIEGDSLRDQQTMYSAIYCLIKESAFQQMHVDIEELRAICKARGCYDSANFTSNFRRDGRISELKGTGRDKRYMATKKGLEQAKDFLRNIATAD